MKKLQLILLLIIGSLSVEASFKQDTTIVEFTDKGVKKRITVYTSSKKDFDLPKNLNLDNVLKSIGVDSSERKKAIITIEQNGEKQDTILVIARDGRNIKIVAKDPRYGSSQSDTLRNGQDNEHWSRRERDYSDNDDDDDDNKKYKKPKKDDGNRRFFSRGDFGIYLGLNNWITPSGSKVPELDTWGSRYVAVSFGRHATLINGKKVDLAFSYGPEISWSNYMFEENNMIDFSTKQIIFNTSAKDLKRSKLVVTNINLPMMLNFGFEEAKFKIGFGGYVGYRIGSYRKLKYSEGGKKEHDKSNYGLNDFRYGLTAELGKRKGLTFFARYDLNELFKKEQKTVFGIQAWSIGLRL